MRFCLLI